MADSIKVHLTGPAKVGGRWFKVGEEDVSIEEFEALEEAGLIDPDHDGFKALVAASDAKINATFAAENETLRAQMVDLQAQLTERTAERDLAVEMMRTAQDELANTSAVLNDLKAQLLAGQQTGAPQDAPAQDLPDTPPSSSTAAKTVPKKGAAATTKG